MNDDTTPTEGIFPQSNNPSYYQHMAIGKKFPDKKAENTAEESATYAMIEIHRKELEDIAKQLAEEARKRTILASIVKVSVIVLGALIAIKEVANQLIGASNTVNVVFFTTAGLLVTVLTGLEATFKWEKTSAELKIMIAACRATSRKTASNLANYVTARSQEKPRELKKILDNIDTEILEIQKKSASLGIETVIFNNAYVQQTLSAKYS